MTSPFVQLPVAVRVELGELDLGWTEEARADCGACPLVALHRRGVAYPFSMADDARCCTAQPNLANFLVGRYADAAIVRRRIANRDGVSAWGIRATAGYDAAFPARAATGFGRDVTLRCPFWVGGEHACGVWSGRSARCRGFFCRHDRGLTGAMAWSQAAGLGVALEAAIADFLVEKLGGVAGDDDDAMLAWYARCAVAADRIDAAAAAAIVRRVPPVAGFDEPDRIARSARGRLIARLRVHQPQVPARLVPAISAVRHDAEGVWLAGYSTFDAVRAPASVFALLAVLDGTTPWRDALAIVAVQHPELDEALVDELRRIGALRDPAGGDDPPEVDPR